MKNDTKQAKEYQANILLSRLMSKIKSKLYPYYLKVKADPLWLLMFLTGRFRIVHSIIAFFFKFSKVKEYDLKLSSFADLKVDDVVESLEKDGVYLGLQIPKPILEEIITFANSNDCYGDGEYTSGFLYSEKDKAIQQREEPFVRAEYYNTAVLSAAINKLANDPKILDIATKYLGKTPAFLGSRLHWIFVVNKPEFDLDKGAMNFHYDIHDFRCLRFFFYITDVDPLSGPHVCILGSHTRRKLSYVFSFFRRRSEAELVDYYGTEKILSVCGPAGFGFVEDVFCFHRATPPISKDRLLLQLQYGLHDYGEQSDFVDQALLKRCVEHPTLVTTSNRE